MDELVSLSAEEMREVDRVILNLVVAKGIPALADLDIGRYVALADKWADEIRRSIPDGDANFRKQPELWQNDLDFARLAVMCWYVDGALGIQYREDQRNIGPEGVLYTDPCDLMTKKGECCNNPGKGGTSAYFEGGKGRVPEARIVWVQFSNVRNGRQEANIPVKDGVYDLSGNPVWEAIKSGVSPWNPALPRTSTSKSGCPTASSGGAR